MDSESLSATERSSLPEGTVLDLVEEHSSQGFDGDDSQDDASSWSETVWPKTEAQVQAPRVAAAALEAIADGTNTSC